MARVSVEARASSFNHLSQQPGEPVSILLGRLFDVVVAFFTYLFRLVKRALERAAENPSDVVFGGGGGLLFAVIAVIALLAVYDDRVYLETCQSRGYAFDECVDKYRAAGACKERR